MDKTRSPWREPMVWLLVALPLSAVVAAFALLFAAARSSGNNDLVADPVQQTGQIQVADLGPDTVAQQRQLSAVFHVGARSVEVIPVTGDFDRHAGLRLSLRHPARAASDRELALKPSTNGWQAMTAVDASHDWIVRLSPADGSWRIEGRLPRQQRAVRLAPRLAPD
ncbi:FixH family protein [Cognatiluteimonas profundi]|uniref:FixH family protein n=1 Tax=Cognatiluteimonas profundi TaxID=2594501 RepID=UPI00131EA7A9|nr:FixH family protein [Lysobacter profundi]